MFCAGLVLSVGRKRALAKLDLKSALQTKHVRSKLDLESALHAFF